MSLTFVLAFFLVVGVIGIVLVLWLDRPKKSKQ